MRRSGRWSGIGQAVVNLWIGHVEQLLFDSIAGSVKASSGVWVFCVKDRFFGMVRASYAG
jgi:hypothetical protein